MDAAPATPKSARVGCMALMLIAGFSIAAISAVYAMQAKSILFILRLGLGILAGLSFCLAGIVGYVLDSTKRETAVLTASIFAALIVLVAVVGAFTL